jgi:UDP-N-acetylglucosamine--dolichyl-phosphate N-acetylglucosaminephosphotransferase
MLSRIAHCRCFSDSVDLKTMSLYPSKALFTPEKPAKSITVFILRLFSAFKLVHLEWDISSDGQRRLHSTTNLTILNAILVFRGVRPQQDDSSNNSKINNTQTAKANKSSSPRINEYQLWCSVMILQTFCSFCAFAVRYWLAAVVFP